MKEETKFKISLKGQVNGAFIMLKADFQFMLQLLNCVFATT